jgi:hypothetical protein
MCIALPKTSGGREADSARIRVREGVGFPFSAAAMFGYGLVRRLQDGGKGL